MSFKPESEDGLIFFNGQNNLGSGDFVSFGLQGGFPELRFNVGSGVTVIKAEKPIQVGEWHTGHIWRDRKNGSLASDGQKPVLGFAEGIFQGLDLLEPFYLGGLPDFYGVHEDVGFSRGFVGKPSLLAPCMI